MTDINAMDLNAVRALTKAAKENRLYVLLREAELGIMKAASKGIDEYRTQPMSKEERDVVTKAFTKAGYLVEDSMVVGTLTISWEE